MDSCARRYSVSNVFAVRHSDLIAGQRVLLVDDVYTTGATVPMAFCVKHTARIES